MTNASKVLAEHLERTTFDDLVVEDIHWAKQRIADSIGVLLAGVNGVGNDKVMELIHRWGGTKEASIFATSEMTTLQDAAWMNSFMLRAYDFEAIDAEVEGGGTLPAHITGSTMPVMFAVGEHVQATGRDMICALILADDLAARLIGSVGFGLYDAFDGNGTANCMGATALAGKLMGLQAPQFSHAFGIALNMCGGSMENVFQGTWAFKLPLALSSRNGIIAAEMAALGLCGVSDPFFDARCYFDMFGSDGQNRDALLVNLGKRYFSDIVIKPWPSCHATQYAIDAALEITEGQGSDPEQIESIVIRVSPSTKGFVGQDFGFGTTSQPAGAFSLRFTVASAILHGDMVSSPLPPGPPETPAAGARPLLGSTHSAGS